MTDIFLIRHGLTDGNVSKVVMGRGAHPLNTEGRAQARRLARFLKDTKLDAIYVSPSRRALQTAQIIMKGRDTIPLIEEADVDEIDFGQWVGKSVDEIKTGGGFDAYMTSPEGFATPGGEAITNVRSRAAAAIGKIVAAHPGQRIAVISHADVIKAVLTGYLGMPLDSWQTLRVDTASVSILRFAEGSGPRVIVINCHGDIERYLVW